MTATSTEEVSILQTRTKESPKAPLRDEGERAPLGSSSLRLLATYSGSSDSSDDADGEGIQKNSNDTLPIPSAIHDMFETGLGVSSETLDRHEEKGVSVISFWDSPGDDDGRSLGYFEAGESSSSGEDSRRERGNGVLRSDAGNEELRGDKVARWNLEDSELCLTSYTCWKCNHVGHLPQDCTVRVSTGAGGQGGGVKEKVPKTLQLLYATCREIRSKKGQWCADCGVHSNLACCLDCRYVRTRHLCTLVGYISVLIRNQR